MAPPSASRPGSCPDALPSRSLRYSGRNGVGAGPHPGPRPRLPADVQGPPLDPDCRRPSPLGRLPEAPDPAARAHDPGLAPVFEGPRRGLRATGRGLCPGRPCTGHPGRGQPHRPLERGRTRVFAGSGLRLGPDPVHVAPRPPGRVSRVSPRRFPVAWRLRARHTRTGR